MLVKLAQMLYAKVVGCFMGNPNNMGYGGSISPPVRDMRPKSGQKWHFSLCSPNGFPEKQVKWLFPVDPELLYPGQGGNVLREICAIFQKSEICPKYAEICGNMRSTYSPPLPGEIFYETHMF